ncbi:MAG: ribonuclease H-like YkuK family protein [Patescibacteria group bacterium]
MREPAYISPTKGKLSFDEVFADITRYVEDQPEDNYRLIVGTDSQIREDVCFVTAIIIHREGKGARFFYSRSRDRVRYSLKQRIFHEAARSLGVASQLAEKLAKNGLADLNIEIHLDVGEQGKTKELIREVVGMITGSGFGARIKPESYGATTVADKFTK